MRCNQFKWLISFNFLTIGFKRFLKINFFLNFKSSPKLSATFPRLLQSLRWCLLFCYGGRAIVEPWANRCPGSWTFSIRLWYSAVLVAGVRSNSNFNWGRSGVHSDRWIGTIRCHLLLPCSKWQSGAARSAATVQYDDDNYDHEYH